MQDDDNEFDNVGELDNDDDGCNDEDIGEDEKVIIGDEDGDDDENDMGLSEEHSYVFAAGSVGCFL